MNMLRQGFLDRLDSLLWAFLDQFSCASWGRSTLHNQAIGGAANSEHRQWNAADLVPDDLAILPALAQKAIDLGFTGIELDKKNNHLHVDIRTLPWHVVSYPDGTEEALEDYLLKGKS